MSKSNRFKKYILIPAVTIMIFSFLGMVLPVNSYASGEDNTSAGEQAVDTEITEEDTIEEQTVEEDAVPEEATEPSDEGEQSATGPGEGVVDTEEAAVDMEVPDEPEEEIIEESIEDAEEDPASEPTVAISFSTDGNGYVTVGEAVSFSATVSGMEPAEFYWDFGDGSDSLGRDTSHTYLRDGNYTVKLTVKDINGFTYGTSTTVHASDHDPTTTEWWVSAEAEAIADDFADGNTSETPVSVESVISRIVDGDTLYFLPGIYTGTYTESTDSAVSLDGIGFGIWS